MAENTRLRDVQQQVQSLQKHMQTTDETYNQRFLDFKSEIITLFEQFQDRFLHHLNSPSIPTPSAQPGVLGSPPQTTLSTSPFPFENSRHRSLKHDFPRFSTGDPTDWPFQVECYCQYSNIPIEDRLLLASIHLDQPAARRFQGLLREDKPHDWNSFTSALYLRFGPTEFEDPAGTLMKLVQTTSVLDYQAIFETLSSRVSGLSPSLLKSTFISGLKPHIRRAVIPLRPLDLHAAIALARVFEDQFKDDRAFRPWPPKQSSPAIFNPLLLAFQLLHLPHHLYPSSAFPQLKC